MKTANTMERIRARHRKQAEQEVLADDPATAVSAILAAAIAGSPVLASLSERLDALAGSVARVEQALVKFVPTQPAAKAGKAAATPAGQALEEIAAKAYGKRKVAS